MSKTFRDTTTRHFLTHDELAALDRDLKFCPAPTFGKKLTSEQLQFYNREGYPLPFRVFSDDEIGQIRAHFDDWLEEADQHQIRNP